MRTRSGRTWWSSVMNLFEERPAGPKGVLLPTESANSHTMIGSSNVDPSPNFDYGQATVSKVDGPQVGSETSKMTAESNGTNTTISYPENSRKISFEDFFDINNIVFEWADSYDNKDWKRLAKILAPSMMIDYSIVGHERMDNVSATDFIAMMSSEAFLGDPLVRTQHLMGARKLEYVSDKEVIGHHQIRAAHLRYCPDGKTVENHGHGHSFIKHWYLKVDGVWKLSGLCPKIYFNEGEFEKIFVQLNY